MAVDEKLRVLAGEQHGAASWEQARGLGFTRAGLRRRLGRGEWRAVTPRVLLLRGAPASELQTAMIAVLDAGPGAVLSHHAAAALWDLPGFLLRDLHVTRPRGGPRRRTPLAVVHACRVVHQDHVTAHNGIPVTTPARTLFDLAALVHPKRVERALETAWSKHLVDGARMVAMLDDLGRRGRAGTSVMRLVLSERGPDYVPPASGLEGRFRDLLARAGLRPMVRQVDVGREQWLGRVDFVDRSLGLIVQIDSERYHGSLIDKRADDAQTAALEAAGFIVERFTDTEVWYCGDEVVARLREARRRRTGA
ncbi:MAG: DUF559 domain-containing protein [Acidimicrobiia bacterium]